MDPTQDTTQPVDATPEPEAPKGKIAASFDVHITLREGVEGSIEAWMKRTGSADPVPTITKLERAIADELYIQLPYFDLEQIHVSATRTDK